MRLECRKRGGGGGGGGWAGGPSPPPSLNMAKGQKGPIVTEYEGQVFRVATYLTHYSTYHSYVEIREGMFSLLKDKGEVQLGYPELPVFYRGSGDQLCKWRRSRVWGLIYEAA